MGETDSQTDLERLSFDISLGKWFFPVDSGNSDSRVKMKARVEGGKDPAGFISE